MGHNPVTLTLSDDVYANVRRIAEESNRPVEAILRESVGLLFGDPSADPDLADLPAYTDEQLWAVVHRHLSKAQLKRLRELSAKGKRGALSDAEGGELERLIDLNDRFILLRSEALVLLQRRGHEIAGYLKMGRE